MMLLCFSCVIWITRIKKKILANLIVGSQHRLTDLILSVSGDPLINGSDKQTEKVASVFFLLPITHLISLSAGVNICVILCHSLPCVTL